MLSILVTAKNHLSDLTIPCIDSIHRFVTIPYEVIGIDDGSSRSTYAYMANRCHKAIRTPGVGPGRARNAGMKRAAGDHILFLDNDVLLERPGQLSGLLAECRKSKAGIIGPVLSNEPARALLTPSADGLIDVSEIAGACFMFPRSTLETLGSLDPAFSMRGEDTDYCFRAILEGLRVCITPRIHVFHKGGGTYNWRTQKKTLKAFRKKYKNMAHILPIP